MTFGCRVNQSDTTAIMNDLESHAFERSSTHLDADVVILNTCTVTHRSDADVRKAAQRIRRENPEAKVVVAGCFAQRAPEQVAALPTVDAVVGHAHRSQLPIIADEILTSTSNEEDATAHSARIAHTTLEGVPPESLPAVNPHAFVFERTRPFVKIQDGCDAPCTYCVIPSVRGAARSAPVGEVMTAVSSLIEQGHFEVVVAGVHLGTYGARLDPPSDLVSLVKQILALDGLGRLRLSCIEPMAFPLALADLAAENAKLAPHFHLPLQSGSDRILKRMVRPYRARDYGRIVSYIRERVPSACIGTDIIVGFPGETEEDFRATAAFAESVGLDYIHVFSYSPREGTAAMRLPAHVDPRIVKERSRRLHAVAEARWAAFLDRQLDRTLPAVTLAPSSKNGAPSMLALADNYAPIETELSAGLMPNQSVALRITERRGTILAGVLAGGYPLNSRARPSSGVAR